ncbi:MAG: hypothetical protein SVR08_01325 [Spirochaetota bacterium]|nr:hypothetical protein [Spirochaetota bacterium]
MIIYLVMTKISSFMLSVFLIIALAGLFSCSKKKVANLKDEKVDIVKGPKTEGASTEKEKEEKDESELKIKQKYKKYLGEYRINVYGYKGVFKLNIINGKLSGTIRFLSWGKGVEEKLKNLKIQNSKISFIRSISTQKDKDRIGATRFLYQRFFGKFSKDGDSIQGYYEDSGSQNTWQAKR